jgi:predicted ATPase
MLGEEGRGGMGNGTFLTRVVLENYKSIASCDIRLGPLTFLVGPNGAGKSNFLDALAFLSDALNISLEQALQKRGGGPRICHAAHKKEASFEIRVEFVLPDGATGQYALRVGLRTTGKPLNAKWEVLEERCAIQAAKAGGPSATFELVNGSVRANTGPVAGFLDDRLYLALASVHPEYRLLFDGLARMRFYNIQAQAIREIETFEPEQILASDGANLTSVLVRLALQHPNIADRINEYLRVVLPGLLRARAVPVLFSADLTTDVSKYALVFEQAIGDTKPHPFFASQMSDGTRRTLAVLTALLQGNVDSGPVPSLVGLEEPEAQVQPAVLRVLFDAMTEASACTQVLVTTQSADLLDFKDVPLDSILVVEVEKGQTFIGPLAESDRSVVVERLYTPGELMRTGRLSSDYGRAWRTEAAAPTGEGGGG